MAALDFPPSPVDGQTYTSGSTTWTYNAAYGVWRITSTTLIGYTGSAGTNGYTGSAGFGYTGSTGIAEDEYARTIALLGL